jgi:hypothetical protein
MLVGGPVTDDKAKFVATWTAAPNSTGTPVMTRGFQWLP